MYLRQNVLVGVYVSVCLYQYVCVSVFCVSVFYVSVLCECVYVREIVP